MIRITPTLALEEDQIEERFIRASGPGGQNVNKVATAVELRVDINATSLPDAMKKRLAELAGHRMTSGGVLIIDSREHRTQARNREAARARLTELLRLAAKRPRRRRATEPSAASRERRLESKKRRADVKKARRQPEE